MKLPTGVDMGPKFRRNFKTDAGESNAFLVAVAPPASVMQAHWLDSETGWPATQRRMVDSLWQMLSHGSITQDMHDVGQLFRSLFRRAAFDTLATSQLLRVSRAASDGASHLQIDAQQKIAAAVDALGGHGSPAGSCVWFVVGLEFSVRDWAARQGWAGKPMHGPVGQEILVAALGTLSRHFGLCAGQRAA